MSINKLIAATVTDQEAYDFMVMCILEVAEKGHGEVRLTIKNGALTHVSSTFSYAAKKGHGASGADPHFRSRVSKKERVDE